jgi:transposase
MANVLKMEKMILIKQLLALGWSYRRIESETGIRRETVAKYDPNHPKNQPFSKPAKVPTDSSSGALKCPPGKPTQKSLAAIHDVTIREALGKGLSAKRIYQDLVLEKGFSGGYDSVKRYVRKLKNKSPKVFARIHTPPGQEAQVDFGKAAPTLKDGRWVRPWLFKIVLSYSRHSYEEVVWRQDLESFIRCHEHAFDAFGGVPCVVRIDNLKSGVLVAHLFEPQLNPVYAAFARHAGFSILPCLPRRPEHKGKVESGVGYTKNNALKGRRFRSLEEQNAHLRHWNKTWARTRIHGTTKKQVWALFIEVERSSLKSLPEKSFQYFKIATRTVYYDGHVEVDRAYYSVPHRFVGQRLQVHFNNTWVKVFHQSQRVAFHRKIDPGRFATDRSHLPEKKSLSTREFTDYLLRQCDKIGPNCHQWAQSALKVRDSLAIRAVQGVVRLTSKFSSTAVDAACSKAIRLDAYRYHTVKQLAEDRLESENPQKNLLQEHELIRGLDHYTAFVEKMSHNHHP